MTSAKNMSKWMYVSLSLVPAVMLSFAAFSVLGKPTGLLTDGGVPASYWYGAFACLPAQAAVVGAMLAWFLSFAFKSKPPKVSTAIFFSIAWNLVFGYLSFFVFMMGFFDGPGHLTVEQFKSLFCNIIFMGLPYTTLISLVVCTIATAVCVFMWQGVTQVMERVS